MTVSSPCTSVFRPLSCRCSRAAAAFLILLICSLLSGHASRALAITITPGVSTPLTSLFPQVSTNDPSVPYWYLAIQQPTASAPFTVSGTSTQMAFIGGKEVPFYFFDQGIDPYYGGSRFAPISSGNIMVDAGFTGTSILLPYVVLQYAKTGPNESFCGFGASGTTCFSRYNIIEGSVPLPVGSPVIYKPERKAEWFEHATYLQRISDMASSITLVGSLAAGSGQALLNFIREASPHLISNPDLSTYLSFALLLVGAALAIGGASLLGVALVAIGLISILTGSAANNYFRLAADPPDPHFSEVVAYSNAQPSFDFGLGDDEVNERFAALFSSLIHAVEASNGAIVSLERFYGATEAGDTTAAALQRSAFEMFSSDMADAEAVAGAAIADFRSFLISQGFGDIVSPDDPSLTMYGVLNTAAATFKDTGTAVQEPDAIPLIVLGLFVAAIFSRWRSRGGLVSHHA